MTPAAPRQPTIQRLVLAAVTFLLMFAFFALDWLGRGPFTPGILSVVAVVAMMHVLAFDAVFAGSSWTLSIFWVGVAIIAAALSVALNHYAKIALVTGVFIYSSLLMWCLKYRRDAKAN